MKTKTLFLAALAIALAHGNVFAQTLTVREIMAEPSIAGMRVEGEKLSPDGSKVVYLWNAEGKMPRDLYLVSTSGGTPQKILSISDLPVPSRTPEKENKLDYGLEVRDQFVKDRENQLGNFEWSPDSKRLVFSYSGDLYIFDIDGDAADARNTLTWNNFKLSLERMSDVLLRLVERRSGLIPGDRVADQWMVVSRRRLSDLLKNDGPSKQELRAILDLDNKLELGFEKEFGASAAALEQLRNDIPFQDLLTEFATSRNRVKVAKADYDGTEQSNHPRRLTQTQTPEAGARFCFTLPTATLSP